MLKLGLLLLLLANQAAPQYEVVGQFTTRIRSRFAMARIESVDGRFVKDTTLALDGKFHIAKIPEGQYFISVRMGRGREWRQSLSVAPAFADKKKRVTFKIDVAKATIQQQAYKANVAALLVPEKARSELRKSIEAKGDLEKAQRHLERAIEIAPNFEEALNNLATIYYRKRDYAKAKELLERALRANPDSFVAHVNLGGALMGLGDFNRAVIENTKAVALRPSDSLAQAQLGLAYFYLYQFSDALPHLRLARQGDPMAPTLPGLFLGMIYEAFGDRPAAIAEYEEFMKAHPGHSSTNMVRQRLDRLKAQ